MKKALPFSLIFLSLFGLNACKSPTKAAVKHKTGVGKGPVEKTAHKAEKKTENLKKDVGDKIPGH